MQKLLILIVAAFLAEGQMQGMNMGAGNFNLSTRQGIQDFLTMKNINPSQLLNNCVPNGNWCTPGGQHCCLSPVLDCQPARSGGHACMVSPDGRRYIPMMNQILQTVGVSTRKPIQ